MVRKNLQHSSQSRVFVIEDRAGPSHIPQYQAMGRALGVTVPFGGINPVRIPDPERYGQFLTIDKIRQQPALPSTSIEIRNTRDLSAMYRLARKGCPIDLQIHIGACQDVQDFDKGWEKIGILEDADFTQYQTSELGAMDADQEAQVMETLDITGSDYYEVKRMLFSAMAESQIVQQVIDVAICDQRTCGACGLPSDGVQRVFALQISAGASPGSAAELVTTVNGGSTWLEQNVTTLPVNLAPIAIACVGPYLVVISNADCAAHYALITDILAGTSSWTRIATGLVCAAGAPNAIFSLSRTQSWIVGAGGYIYFSSDPTSGFTPQSSGDVTTQPLSAIHGMDESNLLAGGTNNALLRTTNGGVTWMLVTGPSAKAAVAINAVYMASENEWHIGYNDGSLYYTIDGGVNWVAKVLPASPTVIDAIEFATRSVGYIAAHTAIKGLIYRTVNGGASWYVLPEQTGAALPTNLRFYGLAASGDDPNVVWAGGIKTLAGDGILVKGS